MKSRNYYAQNNRRGLTLGEFRTFTEDLPDDVNIKCEIFPKWGPSVTTKKIDFIQKINNTIYLEGNEK